ncbi:hypothetical protein [Streptomyces sporangiiformans]|uniref:Peptidase C83 domain-containing protein n=1 Tax=Streptomyces sporangiiformans TaxID=2315329 RepID=A0A505D2A3_9ACTN|nr:hypothetical protein [Streptomyces sporangiiformans]TPQ16332.1 hypothetical protein FGD71_042180 [Streptomyces sporangiiformans]
MSSNQPYEGYDPHHQQQPVWPGQQQYDERHQEDTQQWEGQTWETQFQPQVPPASADEAPAPAPADTAYQQPQAPGEPAYGTQQYGTHQYGTPSGTGHGYGTLGQPLPPEAQPGYASQSGQGYAAAQTPGWDHAVQAPVQDPAYGDFAAAPAPSPAPAAQASGDQAAAPSHGAPAYGPPTVTGNPRVTDAQRARAEGRSPIIEPGGQPAALTAALGLLLSGAAAIGQYALVVPLVILQALTAAGWFRLNGMWPARQGIALAFAGALTADIALLTVGRENAPAAILGTLGVWVLLTLVLQLRSHADPDERMYGLMATVASAALAIVATGHLAAVADAVTVGGAAVAAAILVRALPLPTPVSVLLALLAAAGVGVGLGGVTGFGTGGALLGAAAGGCALIGHRVAAYDYPSRFVHFTAGVALPLAAAAPAIYVVGRALA